LLADAEAGKIGRVYVYKFDRLGRAGSAHAIVDDLEDLGVEVVSATEGDNALVRGMSLVIGADFSRQLAQRTRDGLERRHAERAWTGGTPPFGYEVYADERGIKRLRVKSDEAEHVRFIFNTYVRESIGFRSLAGLLEERGVPTQRGRPWSGTTIKAILERPIYTGEVRFGVRTMRLNRQTGRRVPRFNDASMVRS